MKIDNPPSAGNHAPPPGIYKYAAVAVLAYFVFIAILLPGVGGHPWGFWGFFNQFVLKGQTDVPERFISSKFGYDGQFCYFLSLSPFIKDASTLGYRFDNQAIRQQRILYPLLIHWLAWGNPGLTAWCMVMLNAMAVTAFFTNHEL